MELNRMTVNTKLSGYLPIPLDLLQTELSSTAILLYGLLLDRGSLSRKNNYTDYGGWVYVVYAREDLAQELHISTRMVTSEDVAIDRVEIISFSGVPVLASTMSRAFMAQGIFMLIRLPVIKAR